MFAYCSNNPINYVDAFGFFRQSANKYRPVCVEDGNPYIYDQKDSSISSLPLGESTVGINGCGVVASYNAMLDMGVNIPFEEVYNWYVNNLSVFDGYGKYGVFIGTVADFFEEHGYDTVTLISWAPEVHHEYAQKADASIMLYRYKTSEGSNGHYVAYCWTGQHYLGRNTNGGIEIFNSPWDFGTRGARYFAYEVFVFERKG